MGVLFISYIFTIIDGSPSTSEACRLWQTIDVWHRECHSPASYLCLDMLATLLAENVSSYKTTLMKWNIGSKFHMCYSTLLESAL